MAYPLKRVFILNSWSLQERRVDEARRKQGAKQLAEAPDPNNAF